MTMETTIATLVCCILAFSFAVADTENLNVTTTLSSTSLNLTDETTTATLSTTMATVIFNTTENTTPFDSTTPDRETFTTTIAATTEATSHLQTTQLTTVMTSGENKSPLTTETPLTNTPPFTTPPPTSLLTTGGYTSSSDITVTSANSSHTVKTTTDSMHRATKGSGLDTSEINLTILFSVLLGVFVLALVLFMFLRCKHKVQYMHQPLNNTDGDASVADDDVLVISGGLYDGHPIYDNVPTASEDQSQFRLEFLH